MKIFGKEIIDENAIKQLENCLLEDSIGVLTADAHYGYSHPIGGAIAYKNHISMSGVGFDIACFSGDTKVALADGRHLTFLELIEEEKSGKKNYCYSLDKNQNIVIAKIENPKKTRNINEILEITLDNNKKILCTKDHIFYKRDNSEIKAHNLKIGDSMMPFYQKKLKDLNDNENFKEKRKRNLLKEYNVVYNPANDYYEYCHFLADNYNLKNNLYKFEKGKNLRHHIDFNKYNNNPSNIQKVGWKEHWEIHYKNASSLAKAGKIGFKLQFNQNPERWSELGSRNMKKNHLNPEFRKNLSLRARNNAIKASKNPLVKEKIQDNGKRGREFLINYNQSENGKKISSETFYKKHKCSTCNEIFDNLGILNKHRGIAHKKELVSCEKCNKKVRILKTHYRYCKNHKIKNIKILKVDNLPVYCLTVNEYHNFALSSGVFVHNCGNAAVQTNIKYQDLDIKKVMDEIMKRVSFGMGRNSKERKMNHEVFDKIEKAECVYQRSLIEVAMLQLGTVGGGNHYVDIFKDENDFVWIGVHFGSRGFGHKTTTGFINLSQGKEFWDKANEGSMDSKPILFDINSNIGQEYIEAMNLAGEYAYAGRELVLNIVLEILENPKRTYHVHNHHNFAWKENHFGEDYWVVRKGCTPAFPGQQGFIGATMKDVSVIVEGIDSESSKNGLYSTVHGAGRVLSRRAAKGRTKWKKVGSERRQVRLSEGLVDFNNTKNIMKELNIELRGADSDESFECYKNLDEVLEYQEDTIKIIHKLYPIGVAMAGDGVIDLYKD